VLRDRADVAAGRSCDCGMRRREFVDGADVRDVAARMRIGDLKGRIIGIVVLERGEFPWCL